jgi:hypothetical protein
MNPLTDIPSCSTEKRFWPIVNVNRIVKRTEGAFEKTGVYPPKAVVETMATANRRNERKDFMVNSFFVECMAQKQKTQQPSGHHTLGYRPSQ